MRFGRRAGVKTAFRSTAADSVCATASSTASTAASYRRGEAKPSADAHEPRPRRLASFANSRRGEVPSTKASLCTVGAGLQVEHRPRQVRAARSSSVDLVACDRCLAQRAAHAWRTVFSTCMVFSKLWSPSTDPARPSTPAGSCSQRPSICSPRTRPPRARRPARAPGCCVVLPPLNAQRTPGRRWWTWCQTASPRPRPAFQIWRRFIREIRADSSLGVHAERCRMRCLLASRRQLRPRRRGQRARR